MYRYHKKYPVYMYMNTAVIYNIQYLHQIYKIQYHKAFVDVIQIQCLTITLARLPGESEIHPWASKTPLRLARSGNQNFCANIL